MQRVRNWSFSIALTVSLVIGGALGHSSLATAQPASPSTGPGFFAATGYRISSPAFLNYFERRGGVRTFGYPVSNEFPLLGRRVQLFQRQMLELSADGLVVPANILDPDVLAIRRIDGLTLPPNDPELTNSAPVAGSAEYATQAMAFINVYVPEDWNGMPVNFQTTFLGSVTCADAFGTEPCDQTLLPAFALEVWGLPTSLPTTDPFNADFVYQRFQRGIMHFSRATGLTQGLLLGDWFKRVIIGDDLAPDLRTELSQSRFLAQYAPTRPLAINRPIELPDTSLAQAFRADRVTAGAQASPEATLPTSVAQTATAVAMTASAIAATQAALQAPLTATALALSATAAAGQATSTPTPGTAVSTIPVVNLGCMGDEQMWFVPRKPNLGVHVTISVTSQRHHDARAIMLGGPIDPGPVTEKVGPLGFVWSWTVAPTAEAFHEWTFYADGLRSCITSGFNSYAPLGATSTPTPTSPPTNTAGPTSTSTPTLVPRPVLTSLEPTFGSCNTFVRARGSGFGTTAGTINFIGPSGQLRPAAISWSDAEVDFAVPSGIQFGTYNVLIAVSGAPASNPLTFLVSTSASPTNTPTPLPTFTATPTPGTC